MNARSVSFREKPYIKCRGHVWEDMAAASSYSDYNQSDESHERREAVKKRERVFAAMKNEPVDKIPCYFTTHFAREAAFGDAAVEEHIKFFREVNPDIQKIMNENLVPNMGTIKTPEDWNCIRTISLRDKFMEDEIELVKRVLDRCDRDAFNIGTLHGIVASTIHPIEPDYGYMPVRQLLCSHLRQNKKPVLDAMKRIADGMSRLAVKFVELGLDGILYAGLGGERFLFADDEFAEYIMPLDKQIMAACQEAGGSNILHMCKTDVNFDRYESYKGLYTIANWGIYEAGLSLSEGRRRFTDCAIMGGLSNHRGPLIEGTPDEIREEVRRVVDEAGRTGFILGTDCTIPMGVPYERMRIAADALGEL